ncbi:MAG: hypothetical protein WC756_08575 [Taibaiella sp.]|jgi:hypothetical protein
MFWIEKIQRVKNKFPPSSFKDPFREGNKIIEKIIVRLLNSTWLNFHNSLTRETLIRNGRLLKTCTIKQLYTDELPRLDIDINFWLFLVNIPLATDFRVYDCKYEPLRELLYLSSGQPHQEFFIVDKKYSWLLYFKVDKMKDSVEIYGTENLPIATL